MAAETDVSQAAAAGLILLDGGLATQLESAGNTLTDELWSARLLADAPDQITQAHLTYYRAGAQVAITASYQASFAGFARRGLDRADASALMRTSVQLAQRARDIAAAESATAVETATAMETATAVVGLGVRPRRWVAASVGPYGASLADGSEYRGRYGLSRQQLWDFHRPRLEVLADARPDLLAIETIPDLDEAAVIIDALDGLQLPAWLSFTVADGKTRAGQPLAEAFAVASASPWIIAVGVNCCAPAEVDPALAVARAVTGKPTVGYPNSGEVWNALSRSWDAAPRAETPSLPGSGFIGGCCRTGPADIKVLQARIRAARS